MKFLSLLSLVTLISSAAFLLGLAFDVQALPLFGVTTIVSVLLIVSRDYARSTTRLRKPLLRRRHQLPFAA
jgi:hypothetical protein